MKMLVASSIVMRAGVAGASGAGTAAAVDGFQLPTASMAVA
jgi:hypothetical protein